MRNIPQTLTQPNGTKLNCFVSGDERYSWLHDANNYTIVLDTVTGYYVYAKKSFGKLVPTTLVAGKADPVKARLVQGVNNDENLVADATRDMFRIPAMKGGNSTNTTGTVNNIAIFIRFADQAEYTDQVAKYEMAFNAEDTASMKGYFTEVSAGQITVNTHLFPKTNGETVVSFQDVNVRNFYRAYNASTNSIGYKNETERASREMGLLKNAVASVKSQLEATGLDFDTDNNNQVDNVTFVLQGSTDSWAGTLWPHMWVLYAHNVTIGNARVWNYNVHVSETFGLNVICHEMSHSFGFQDMYRYTNNTINPVGPWDAMSSTTNPPQHQSVYTKVKYGNWTAGIPEITTAGTYTLSPLSTDPFAAYKIASPNSTSEYFVVEYRRTNSTYESQLLGSGLVIYRVVPSLTGNSFGPNDEVYVFRPNGTNTVDGDLAKAFYSADVNRTSFGGTSNTSCFLSDGSEGGVQIFNIGKAGETITFSVQFGNNAKPALAIAPATRTLGFAAGDATFEVSNEGTGNMEWSAELTSGSEWAHLTGGAAGTNNGTITVEFDENTTAARTATILVKSTNSATEPVIITLTQDFANGTAQVAGEGSLNVYPNPSVKDFTVQVDNYNGTEKTLEVINMMGQVLNTLTLTQETTTVAGSDLPKGMYIFRVTGDDNSVSYKRVVKN